MIYPRYVHEKLSFCFLFYLCSYVGYSFPSTQRLLVAFRNSDNSHSHTWSKNIPVGLILKVLVAFFRLER